MLILSISLGIMHNVKHLVFRNTQYQRRIVLLNYLKFVLSKPLNILEKISLEP